MVSGVLLLPKIAGSKYVDKPQDSPPQPVCSCMPSAGLGGRASVQFQPKLRNHNLLLAGDIQRGEGSHNEFVSIGGWGMMTYMTLGLPNNAKPSG